jgi:hypothetical protein
MKNIKRKEVIKIEQIQSRVLEDIDKHSNVESLALLEMVKIALTQNDNLAVELVIVKEIEIEGLRGGEPMVFTKWSVRQKTIHER